jgi:hypothetical protein
LTTTLKADSIVSKWSFYVERQQAVRIRKWVFTVVGSLAMLGASLGLGITAVAASAPASASAVHAPSITVVDV